MSHRIRSIYHSNQHNTLVLEEDGQRVVYNTLQPPSVLELFAKLGFPESHESAGITISEEPTGPHLVLYRIYVQSMPGQAQPGRLVWCCTLLPDRDAAPPVVLTPAEAGERFGLEL